MTSIAARTALALLLTALAAGCDGPAGAPDGGLDDAGSAPAPVTSSRPAPSASSTARAVGQERVDAADQVERLARFVSGVNGLSEPDAEFFSDNLVSNETSILHVADELPALAPKGGAYVGVGPEQNFSYVAILEPTVAYVVDIRRDNLRLHLLYKAAFEVSRSRAHFVALMLGRPAPTGELAKDANIAAVLARATEAPATAESFAAAQAQLRERIATWGLSLPAGDVKRIEALHRSFFEGQLDLRFSLKEANGRKYPTLSEMLSATDREGKPRGFLTTDEAFTRVQTMQREHRIIPVVGDFAGDKALPGVATALREAKAEVSVFYVSNVEQYLLEPKVWEKWRRNVAALPRAKGAVFLRAWLDQGRAHPRQEKGHRTASFLASMDRFESAQTTLRYPSWWAVANDGILEQGTD